MSLTTIDESKSELNECLNENKVADNNQNEKKIENENQNLNKDLDVPYSKRSSSEISTNNESQEIQENLITRVNKKSRIDDDSNSDTPKKKVKKKKYLKAPYFSYDENSTKPIIKIADVRSLILYLITENSVAPSFVSVHNRCNIKKVVVIFVPGISLETFGLDLTDDNIYKPTLLESLDESKFINLSFFKKHFTHLWPTKAPGENDRLYSPMQSLLSVPFTKAEKQKFNNKLSESAVKISPKDLIMSFEELLNDEYPIHKDTTDIPSTYNTTLPDGWVETFPKTEEKDKKNQSTKIFAVDCEMCKAGEKFVLTKIAVVDYYTNEVVLNELVSPSDQITDYVTEFSGITAAMLQNVKTTLKDIQARLLDIFDSNNTILIGHSLVSDLNACKLRHPLIIDTSVIYHNMRGPPFKPSLKWLSSKYLNLEIQNSSSGHDPIIDASTCISLVKLKCQSGFNFGLVFPMTESILTKISKSENSSGIPRSCAIIDNVKNARAKYKEARIAISCNSDDEAADAIIDAVQSTDFLWARLGELELIAKWKEHDKNVQNPITDSDDDNKLEFDVTKSVDEETKLKNIKENDSEKIQKAHIHLNDTLEKIYQTLPNGTAFFVMSGSGDPRDMNELIKQYRAYKKEFKSLNWDQLTVKWTDVESQALKSATKKARIGVSFFQVIQHEASE